MSKHWVGSQRPAGRGCGLSLATGPNSPLKKLGIRKQLETPRFQHPALEDPREARRSKGWALWRGSPTLRIPGF
eukprot:5754238-Alexandrium_andersonii.AAC.1